MYDNPFIKRVSLHLQLGLNNILVYLNLYGLDEASIFQKAFL
jgi:hypothetical protein